MHAAISRQYIAIMAARFARARWHGTVWSPVPASGLAIETDLTPAAWIEPRLRARSFEVGMTAPAGFEAYARILFPFEAEETAPDGTGQAHVTWTETARRSHRIAHALMEQETIQEPGRDEPVLDELADEQLDALLPILTRHTSADRSWFLLWEGFGDLNQRVFDPQPKVRHPSRNFYLLSGPTVSYRNFPHDPNYCWPDDQTWCLCTDTDFRWAYIAGSADCIADVLSVPELDAYRTELHNPARMGMDVINDPHGTVAR
jgi:hypothetical protein